MKSKNINEGMKWDKEKLMYELVPPTALEGLVRILTYGAQKYAPENWRKVRPVERYYAALMRHLEAVRKGEWLDPESGFPHMDHVMCNAMFLRELWGEAQSDVSKPASFPMRDYFGATITKHKKGKE